MNVNTGIGYGREFRNIGTWDVWEYTRCTDIINIPIYLTILIARSYILRGHYPYY